LQTNKLEHGRRVPVFETRVRLRTGRTTLLNCPLTEYLVDSRSALTVEPRGNPAFNKLQYAMRDRLRSLGWRDIEVVDEDLGRSASGTLTRAGFERMVAEVCLGHVGAVAAREVSRFARNSREWQKLVEVCRVVDTLLIDQEMVYSPRQSNDRLLLGLNRPETQSTSYSTLGLTSIRTNLRFRL
jgi:hypothetical protein